MVLLNKNSLYQLGIGEKIWMYVWLQEPEAFSATNFGISDRPISENYYVILKIQLNWEILFFKLIDKFFEDI